MALTITEQFRQALSSGGRLMCFDVTQDETTSTIAAASIDLSYIKSAMTSNHRLASCAANTSTLSRMMNLSITGNSDELTILLPAKTGSKFTLWAIGW